MTRAERDRVIEQCAAVIDRLNSEGSFQAIAGAKHIRALKDEPHAEGDCIGKILNQTCSPDERRCGVCGFKPSQARDEWDESYDAMIDAINEGRP